METRGPFEARYVAFLETIANLRPSLHRYCSRMTGSVLDGEDVVQEALFQAYRMLDGFDDSRPLAPWLFRIAHNRCIDSLRRREVRKDAETAVLDPDPVMPVEPPGLALGRAVEHLVLSLPPMERACVLLKDVFDYSLEEIAELVDSTVGGVKAALQLGAVFKTERRINRKGPIMNTQTETNVVAVAPGHPIVSPEEWLQARKGLLAKEKEFTRLRDELSRQRRELPWERVEKNYVFEGPQGRESLADLFAGRSQLIVYHFMFGPDWPEGCPSCSMVADHFDGSLIHLAQRDVTLVVASRARREQIEAFQNRMGWHFKWVSSNENDFNRDSRVSFTTEELSPGAKPYNYGSSGFPTDEAPGVSVFFKDAQGDIFHTYSSYGRGVEELLGVYSFLDFTSKGRDEDDLPFPMAWVRHHDRYEGSACAHCSGEEHA